MQHPSVHRASADPLEDPGALHARGPVRRGFLEFAWLPLTLTTVFVLLAVGVSLLDRMTGDGPVRRFVSVLVPGDAAEGTLQAAATSLLTVTSITFSVLLVAVQQTATSLTSVIFDQFLHRVANRVYSGLFVGVTAFAFIALGMSRTRPAPVYAATGTLVLTLAAIVALLLLAHATIDQMRPQTVVRSIQDLALKARERELELVAHTRAAPALHDAPSRQVAAPDSGYVVGVDVERLGHLAEQIGDAEAVVLGALGDYVVYGDPVVALAGVDPDDDGFDEEAISAFRLEDVQSARTESAYAIGQLENIAWSAGTSAAQSPKTAEIAIRALRDVAGRWLLAGERDRSGRSEHASVLPVVYRMSAVDDVFGALAELAVGAAESRQAQTCAAVLDAFAGLAPRLRTEHDRSAFTDCLDAVLPSVLEQARLPRLALALDGLEASADRNGLGTGRIREIRGALDGPGTARADR